MIYLILTSSLITNRFRMSTTSQRLEEYRSAITETLSHLPNSIRPIIVENNGARPTCLDQFTHNGKPVSVIYTENNKLITKSKGTNELFDLHEVIDKIDIQPNDMIIKITGRYQATNSDFFRHVIEHEATYDGFVKFYNVCSLSFHPTDSVLGCYALRAFFIKGWNPYTISHYPSAEVAFAKYVRLCGGKIKEMEQLGIRCHFSEDGRTLDV